MIMNGTDGCKKIFVLSDWRVLGSENTKWQKLKKAVYLRFERISRKRRKRVLCMSKKCCNFAVALCARVRQLKRTELAWRVGSAQCLRSPQKSQIFGGPERSNRTAKPIVRPKGDKNSLGRSRDKKHSELQNRKSVK